MSTVIIQGDLYCSKNGLTTVLTELRVENKLQFWEKADGTIEFNWGTNYSGSQSVTLRRESATKWVIEFTREAQGAELYGRRYTVPGEFASLQTLINLTDHLLENRIRRQERRKEDDRLKEEQAIKDSNREINKALPEITTLVQRFDFELAETKLSSLSEHFRITKREIEIKDTSNYIAEGREHWLKEMHSQINLEIEKKNWQIAKEKLDSIPSQRLHAGDYLLKMTSLRDKLNNNHKDWLKEEERRKQIEAESIALGAVESWSTEITTAIINEDSPLPNFIKQLLAKSDGELMKNEPNWRKSTELSELVKQKWHALCLNFLKQESEQISRTVSRANVLTDQVLSEGFLHNNEEWLEEKFFELADIIEPGIGQSFSIHNYSPNAEDLVGFSLIFMQAEQQYVEEVKRKNNSDSAKQIVGHQLGMAGCDTDLATKIDETYIGTVQEIEYFRRKDDGSRGKKIRSNEELVQMIESGEDLIIKITECYEDSDQAQQGHLKSKEKEELEN
jgi:hypothetical protein